MARATATKPDTSARLPKEYWEDVRRGIKLPRTVRAAAIPDHHAIFREFLPSGDSSITLFEVGCAPGRWLDYFAKNFGYTVAGLDYAPDACQITRQNLALLNTPARIIHADLFACEPGKERYDVVLSVGLIEHFVDLNGVVGKLVDLISPDGGFIATIVPNLYGLEGWVLKTLHPKLYDGHAPISLSQLTELHESAGVETLFSNYVGGYAFPPPLRDAKFARNHRWMRLLANFPAAGFNRIMRYAGVAMKKFPRSRFWSPHLLYIGRKTGPAGHR